MVDSDNGRNVFVIEPDAAIRDGLKALIATRDITVLCYRDAEMFMEFVCVRRPTRGCLLLEAELPGIGCFELLRRLRKQGASIPAIVLVSTSNVWMSKLALNAGAREVFKKPLLNGGVLDCVLRVLDEQCEHSLC